AFAELLARLRALLRRGGPGRETGLRAGDLEVDLLERRAARAGAPLALTHPGFGLLVYLLRHQGEPVPREMLGRDVWHEPGDALPSVTGVPAPRVRRKLERPGLPPLVHTLRGVGYTLRAGGGPCG